MSDLDEKLKEVLDDAFATEPNGEVWLVEPVIERIKQAFIDADWSAPIEYDKPPKQMFGEPVLLDPTKQLAAIPIAVMTGQEWYDRFEKELQDSGMIDTEDGDNVDIAERVASVYMQAARKASGLA